MSFNLLCQNNNFWKFILFVTSVCLRTIEIRDRKLSISHKVESDKIIFLFFVDTIFTNINTGVTTKMKVRMVYCLLTANYDYKF